jgi:hypothetical protein
VYVNFHQPGDVCACNYPALLKRLKSVTAWPFFVFDLRSANNWRRLHQLSSRPLRASKQRKKKTRSESAPTRSCAASSMPPYNSRTSLSTIILLLWRDAFKQLHNDAHCYLFSICSSSSRASERALSKYINSEL